MLIFPLKMAAVKRKMGKKLYDAVLENNFGECKILIAKGANPNYTFGRNKDNALSKAILYELTNIALYLLDNKADLEIMDDDSQRPLHFACETGNMIIFEDLVSRGADIHVIDNSCISPLGYAIRKGNVNICQKLLTLGAKIQENTEEDTAYYMLGNPEIFNCFIKNIKITEKMVAILYEKCQYFQYKDYLKVMKNFGLIK